LVPVIALVGRPNVGKSTLFNRLTRSRDALVADLPGLTRDRKYGDGVLGDRPYILIDTGGVTGEEAGIDAVMARQSMQAVEEADVVLFIVDAKAGLLATDEYLAAQLRRTGKAIHLVINKIDSRDPQVVNAEFATLGFGEAACIAAAHGRGVRALINQVLPAEDVVASPVADAGIVTEADEAESLKAPDACHLAIIGRPNVGKSTLVNRLLGEERVVVFDQAGTTRDSVRIPWRRDEKDYVLIDTAGVRRRGRVSETVEKFSVVKALQAMREAHVVVLVLDAREGIVDQDLHLLGFALESGRSIVIAINKWDGLDAEHKDRIKSELGRRLSFVPWIRLRFISALHGTAVGTLVGDVDRAFASASKRWSTPRLTALLETLVQEHQPPLVSGRRIKLRYAHMGGLNPPTIVIHGNQTDAVPKAYQRYLENRFRELMKLEGTPLRVLFKSGENPYAGRKNSLSDRQVKKRKRLVQHIKKAEKKKKQKK
jgi:GTP-binding protein